jgi:hypothetical protein
MMEDVDPKMKADTGLYIKVSIMRNSCARRNRLREAAKNA